MILERTSIILVDDHQMIMDGLERIIQELPGFEVLASYHNPIEALEKVPLLKPDILIADLEMPQMNGLEMVGLLKRSTPQLTTLLLTMHLDYTMAQKAMKMGVNGYILKNLDKSELQVALLQLKKGKNYFSAEVTEVLSTKSNALERSMSSKRGLLTKKEMEVLRLITESYSTKQIAEKLCVTVSTIESHRSAIMTKLEVQNVAGMVKVAILEGLIE